MLKYEEKEKKLPRAQTMFLALFGPIFVFCPLLALHPLTTLQYYCCLWWFAGIGHCQWQ